MGEKGSKEANKPRTRRRWIGWTLLILLGLLVIFHQPLLLSIGRKAAIHFAARENLKLDCRIEGSVFTRLIVRNVHVVPTGPSPVESIDIDSLRLDYSFWSLLRHGPSQFLENAEMRSAKVVLNPAKAPLKLKPPKPEKKTTLPAFFPNQIRLVDVNLLIRSSPQDLILQHINVELNPRIAGELRIEKAQIPNLHTWSKISAKTSYVNRNLVLRDLVLDDQNRIGLINIDASRISAKSLSIAIEAAIVGGTISGSLSLAETRSSLDAKLHLIIENLALAALNKYLGGALGSLSGDVQRLAIDGSGIVATPRSWNGALAADINKASASGLNFDRCSVRLSALNGTATLQIAELRNGPSKLKISGSTELPRHLKGFGQNPTTLVIAGAFPDLHAITAGMARPVRGSGEVAGRVEIKDRKLNADLNINAGSIETGPNRIEKFNVNLKASKEMASTKGGKPYFADLNTRVGFDVTNARFADYRIDSVHGEMRSEEQIVTVDQLLAVRNQNRLLIRGRYELPQDFAKAAAQPATFDLTLNAPELGDYWARESPDKVTGPLQLNGQIETRHGLLNGQLTMFASNLRTRNLLVSELSLQVSIAKSVVYLNDLTARLNENDYVNASGSFALEKPHTYGGKLIANVANLSTLEPLLRAAGNKNELAGALVVNWQGTGDAAKLGNNGALKLTLEKGRYANLEPLQANIEASYSPEALNIPIAFISSNKMDFQAIAQAKDSTLEISKIQVVQGEAKYASGYISAPFVWRNVGTSRRLIPSDGKVSATFQSENLDIKKLFEDFGAKPVASGFVNVKFDAQGTLAHLRATLDLQLRDLRAEQMAKLEPANFGLTARIENNQLLFSGKLEQTRIQPVQINAQLPFDVSQIIQEGKLNDQTPVTAKVEMPRSSVNFVRQFVPALREIDGDLALNVNVNGTIANPVLSGSGDMTINVARFNNATLPALNNFKSRLLFNRDTLTFEQFGGELAGGPFTLSGRVTFPKLTNPTLDLHLKAESVLVARNDDLTARTDADIKIAGPLMSASVTGNVALTNSQFLKNIDLIPIGLPGRPAPQPPSDRASLSFPQPPLRDWKFDVTIKTKDPFLIRGNLANGGAITDLKLTGTGMYPGLEGVVRLENVEATLPFSRLEIASGFLYFDPSDSLNPRIDLHGTSLIRDYTIHVYVYGTSLAPEAVFTSEPPLPQEEIISLLATGTTREELTGNNNVLAGRAAMLLVQQLYRKVFKKGAATQSNSVFDRLQVDIGAVDPRTGQQSATARYKINQQFVLIGDLGVSGDFRGMVKYVIRFR